MVRSGYNVQRSLVVCQWYYQVHGIMNRETVASSGGTPLDNPPKAIPFCLDVEEVMVTF